MKKYEQYRRKPHRLNYWDYSYKGIYFITISTKYGKNYFGKIINKKMVLNDIGKIAEKYWKEIPNHFDNAKLDEFIIMPNHIHGIIILKYKEEKDELNELFKKGINEAHNKKGIVAMQRWYRRSTATTPLYYEEEPLSSQKSSFYSRISPKSKSLPIIIRSYKSICTREINKIRKDISFEWHRRYYDRIILNNKNLNIVRYYIINNPKNWNKN